MRPSSPRRTVAAVLELVLFLFLLDRGLYRLIVAAEDSLYRDTGYVARFKKYMKSRSFDTLILGTSRTHEAVHPAFFDEGLQKKAYSEALTGRCPRYNYHFYRFFKKLAGRPKVVIYGADYFMFSLKSNQRALARFRNDRRPLRLFEAPSSLLRNKKEIEDFLSDLRVALEGNFEQRGARPNRDFSKIQAYAGKEPAHGRVLTVKPEKLSPMAYRPYPGEEGLYLMELMKELAKDDVQLIFVTIPEYVGTYETNFERRKLLEDLSRLIEGFPNAHLYDFNRPDLFPLDKAEYFIDGGWGKTNSHMSKKGAEAFGRILLDKIAPHYAHADR